MLWADEAEQILSDVAIAFSKRYAFAWKRPHTLQTEAGTVPGAIAVKVAALAGVTALALYSSSSGRLQGIAPSGLVLTIAGTDYTLDAEAEASSQELAVTFTPVLAAGVEIDDAVTVAGTVVKTLRTDGAELWGKYEDWSLDPLEAGSFGARSFQFKIPKNSAPLIPRIGDRIEISALDLGGYIEATLDQTAAVWVVGVSAA